MAENNNWQQQVWQQPQQPQQAVPDASYGSMPYYQQPPTGFPPQAPKKKGRGWIVAIVVVAAVFLLCLIGIGSCTAAIGSSMSSTLGSSGTSAASVTQDSVVVIPLSGTIQYDNTFCSPEGFKAQLDAAEKNNHVKAVVLRVDSGGGVATAGEEMTAYLKNFSKPVVVSSASINASAAYEISSQADYIVTAKTTTIGSIGTAMQVTDLSGLYEKLGIKIDTITSADSKDSSYGNRPLTDQERAYYQAMVDQINATFVESVANGRSMSIDQVKTLATGLPFTGITAVENGLADKIGTLDDAVAKAAELAQVSNYSTVTLSDYTTSINILDLLGSSSSDEELMAKLKELTKNDSLAK